MNGTNRIPKTDPRAAGEAGGHPAIEVLDAYHQGDLSPKEAAQIQHHLIFCRECRDLLLDLARFLEGGEVPSRLWSAELTSAWEQWLSALRKQDTSGSLRLGEDSSLSTFNSADPWPRIRSPWGRG